MTIARLAALALVSTVVACSQAPSESADTSGANETAQGAPKLCTAVRGNGEYIVTHFASLARIVESYGVIDGYAGGSSGSISEFVYDSMLKNDAIANPASDAKTQAARLALALKSVQGYGEVVVASKEATEIGDLVATITRIKTEMESRGILALLSIDTLKAAAELKEVFSIPEVRSLINPEVFSKLEDIPNIAFNAKEIYTSAANLAAFSVPDNRLFFRTGVLNWDGLSDLFGRVGDFYAGVGDADPAAEAAWLDRCADSTVGQSWADISKTQCGADFSQIVTDYRAKVRANGTKSIRLQDHIGAPSRLHKFVSTSVLTGDAVTAWDEGYAQYASGAIPSGDVPFKPNFDDVKMGYWSSDADYATAAHAGKFHDLKTSKMESLGDATWKEILSASPAEPGLSHFVKIGDGTRMSAGGWSDLAPVLVLKNLGCERVIYVTRQGDESSFATAIAKDLGMSEQAFHQLYDLGAQSSFEQSLAAADAVWCTNWNSFTDLQQREMALESWNAPLETHAGFGGITTFNAYANTTTSANKVGCTPGVAGTLKY